MRRALFVLAMLCAALMPARADAPFAPVAQIPDYIATMVEHSVHRKEDYTRTVSHHGAWTRVERFEGAQRATEYSSARGPVDIRIYGSGPNIQIVRGREASMVRDTQPRNTGERQSHLGEGCTVWDVWRVHDGPDRVSIAALSCVTDDGIELWQKVSSRNSGLISSSEATKIERRPVEASAVEPPRSLIALDWWDRDDAAPGATPDYESVLRLDNSDTIRQRITRAHRGWSSVEDTMFGIRHTLDVTNPAAGLALHLTADDTGAPQRLAISKSTPPPPNAPPAIPMTPKDLAKSETVLGERCRWFDMTPGMMDAGQSACRTADGITLKEEHWSRSTRQIWTAIRFARRPVSLAEVTPPKAVLDPKVWGLP